jgi:YbbR domain-containing protein
MPVVVDLRGTGAGIKVIRLTENNIRNKPPGVQILSMTPPRVRLQLDSTLRKIVEVEPELVGEPAEGFEVSKVDVSPSEVVISGPESWVQGVSRARTEPIHIDELSSPLTVSAYVDLEDPRLRIEGTASVQVALTIEPRRREVRIRGVIVTAIPEGSPAAIMTSKVEVMGAVPISFEGRIKAGDLRALVDLGDRESRPEPYEVVPEIEVAQRYEDVFRLKSVLPETIKVRVR